jgi:hypothetical protein
MQLRRYRDIEKDMFQAIRDSHQVDDKILKGAFMVRLLMARADSCKHSMLV